MNTENLISVNVPNMFTVGVFLLGWAAIFLVVSQIVRRAQAAQGASASPTA